MITVFFNEDGYCVTGEGVEVSRRCSPALTHRGDKIFQTIHHSYKILYLALCEIRDLSVQDDVMVYNDSRIIDEINGTVDPLDASCDEWLKIIKRYTIPSIRSVVFFRKQPTSQLAATIAEAHGDMLVTLDRRTRDAIAQVEVDALAARATNRKRRIVDRLKKSWNNKDNAE